MNKRIFSSLVFILSLILIIAGGAQNAYAEPSPEEDFVFDESTGTITGYKGPGGAVEIPSVIGGVTVTNIGGYAFYNVSLTSLTIPGSVYSIGELAFSECRELIFVTLADGVTSIGFGAFFGCFLMEDITIPNSVTNIGQSAFGECHSLTNIIIPPSVTSIGDWAFGACRALTEITIPSSITSIGEGTFFGCISLTGITMYDGITSIGNNAFRGCEALTDVTIPNTVTSIGDEAFVWCTSLTSITMHDGITSIGDSAFQGCTALTDIKIPNSVTSIGAYTFNECKTLTDITVPASVINIGYDAFSSCTSLTRVQILGNITSIEANTFTGCRALIDITIPASVTSIGYMAFANCNALENLTLPVSVTSIGDYAFYESVSLTNINIPNSVTSIGNYAFYGCSSLSNIAVDDANTVYSSENGMLFNKAKTSLIMYPPAKSGDVIIPNSVTSIADNAFLGCTALTGITIPTSVISIGAYAFSGCTELSSVTLPDSLVSIGQAAFYECSKLTSITIPANITTIENNTFFGCTSLTNIIIPVGVTKIGYRAFFRCTALNNVMIPASVNIIEENAFYRCIALTDITLSEGISSIEYGLFSECTALTSIIIPSSVTNIGQAAFYGCTQLTEIVIPYGVNSIIHSTFSGCTSLTNVTIPASITNIDIWAFAGCTSLTSITIPASVTNINRGAFVGCTGLTSIITDDANTVYSSENGMLFNKEKTLLILCTTPYSGDITIPDGVTSIGNNVFYGYTGLTSVTFPASVTNIGDWSFYGCTSLNHAIFLGNAPTVGTSAFVNFNPTFKIYYFDGSTGYTSSWNGYQTVALPNSATMAEDVVATDMAALTWDSIKNSNTAEDSVTSNLNLLVSGAEYGSTITWSTDNTSIISNSGMVMRPSFGNGDANIVVTATISFPGASATKSFNLTVVKLPQVYSINIGTIYGGSITADLASAPAGTTVNLTVSPAKGYRLKANTLKYNDGTDHIIDGTSFTMPADNVTISAEFEAISSNNSHNASHVTITVSTQTTDNISVAMSIIHAEVKVDSHGNAILIVTESQLMEATNRAIKVAANHGEGTKVIVEIKVSAPKTMKAIKIVLPLAAVKAAAEKGIDGLTVSSPILSSTFDRNAIYNLSQATGDISISASIIDGETLPEELQQMVGGRPIIDFNITGNGQTITQFDGNVKVSVPYILMRDEETNAIVIYYINAQNKIEILSSCLYNTESQAVVFTTDHLSKYAVGYNKINFNDVAIDAWYNSAVSFVAARGITSGAGDGNYTPEGKLTRGQFITMVMRAYGMNPDENSKDNFADAGNTYYTDYLAAAKNKGITNGKGNNMFAPEKEITRQEMFTLLYNTLKQMDNLPVTATGKTLESYGDSNEIAFWAKDAMTHFVGTGIISGSNGNLNPTDTTNRAQIAQVLYNLLSE